MDKIVTGVGYFVAFVCAGTIGVMALGLAWYIATDIKERSQARARRANKVVDTPSLKKARQDIEKRHNRLQKEKIAAEMFASEQTVHVDEIQRMLNNEVE